MNCYGPTVAQTSDMTIIDCKTCGYAHQYPISDNISSLYDTNDRFYSEYADNKWYQEKVQEHDRGLWDTCYNWQIGLLKSGYNNQLLDIGCGYGWFMHHWNSSGPGHFRSCGIEPSERARNAAIASMLCAFDCYHRAAYNDYTSLRMSYVLEHVADPIDFISYYHGYNRAANLLVCIPNEFNPLQNMLSKRFGAFYAQVPHVNYFSKRSIQTVLRKADMAVVSISATFPMELFGLMGFNYIDNPEVGHKCHSLRLQFEQRIGINAFKLYKLLNSKLNWGRGLFVVAKAAPTISYT